MSKPKESDNQTNNKNKTNIEPKNSNEKNDKEVITIQEMSEQNLEKEDNNKSMDVDSEIADKEGMISGCIIC